MQGGHCRSPTKLRGAGGLDEGMWTLAQLVVPQTRCDIHALSFVHASSLAWSISHGRSSCDLPRLRRLQYSLCVVGRLCRVPYPPTHPPTLSHLLKLSWTSWSVLPFCQRPPWKRGLCVPSCVWHTVGRCKGHLWGGFKTCGRCWAGSRYGIPLRGWSCGGGRKHTNGYMQGMEEYTVTCAGWGAGSVDFECMWRYLSLEQVGLISHTLLWYKNNDPNKSDLFCCWWCYISKDF